MIKKKDDEKITVLVIGDTLIDDYTYGKVVRLAREAPVPIVQRHEMVSSAGGAAHTALAVAALEADVHYISLVGDDSGQSDIDEIFDGYDNLQTHLYRVSGKQTLRRHRVVADGSMVLRLDSGTEFVHDEESMKFMEDKIRSLWGVADAVILSDYGWGVLNDRLISLVGDLMNKRKLVLSVDAKNLLKYRSLSPSLVKPNRTEAYKLLDSEDLIVDDEVDFFEESASDLLELTGADMVMLTLDRDGALCISSEDESFCVSPPFVSRKPSVGAGDSYVAAATLCFTSGLDMKTVVSMANTAAAMSIEKGSTGVVTKKELDNFRGIPKLYSVDALVGVIDAHKKDGKRIVFTNGCFDMVHPGHVKTLVEAKNFGDILVVGLNSDESIKRLKGPERPINNFDSRVAVLAGLGSVDYIVGFEEDTPEDIILQVRPSVFVKAGYTLDSLPETRTLKSVGCEIKLLDTIPGSTTEIIERIRV